MPGIDFIVPVTNATVSFPVRYSAMHCCLQAGEGNLVVNNSLLGSLLSDFPLYSKVRSRIQVGSIIELQHALRSHGIPMDTFPLDIDGNIRDDILNEWFYKHRLEQVSHNLSPTTGDGNKPASAKHNGIHAASRDQ